MTTASANFQTMPAMFEDGPLCDLTDKKLFGRTVVDVSKTPYVIRIYTRSEHPGDQAPVFTIPVIASSTPMVSYGSDTYPLHKDLRAEARRFALETLGESV